ncbi:MAG: hypothetical protein AABY22_19890 [Nanoarchaeota archaeon]
MIKQHTANSLSKYLNKQVRINSEDYLYASGELVLVSNVGNEPAILISAVLKDKKVSIHLQSDRISCVYPILKTYDKLIKEEKDGTFLIIHIFPCFEWVTAFCIKNNAICENDWGSNKTVNLSTGKTSDYFSTPLIDEKFELCQEGDEYRFPFGYLEKLIDFGFGAIPNSESPTEYVDLFGYPCIAEQ